MQSLFESANMKMLKGGGMFIVLCIMHTVNCVVVKGCQPGFYLDISMNSCEPCQDGRYMPHKGHQMTNCYICTKLNHNTVEYVAANCSKTEDTVIRCRQHGDNRYYWRSFKNGARGECRICGVCSTTTLKECGELSDTLCCPDVGMIVEGDKCIPEPNVTQGTTESPTTPSPPDEHVNCSIDEYMTVQNKTYVCKQCPPGTFQDMMVHKLNACKPCEDNGQTHDSCRGSTDHDSNNKAVEIVAAVISPILFVGMVVGIIIFIRKRRQLREKRKEMGMLRSYPPDPALDETNFGGN